MRVKEHWNIKDECAIDKLLSELGIEKKEDCNWCLGMDDLRYFGSILYPQMIGKIWKEDIKDEWLWETPRRGQGKSNIHRYLVYYLVLLHGKLESIDPGLKCEDPLKFKNSFGFKTYRSIRNLIKYFCTKGLDFRPIQGYSYEFFIHNAGMGLPVIERPYDSLSLHYFYANRVTYRPPMSIPFFKNDFVALEYVRIDDVDCDIGGELDATRLEKITKEERDEIAKKYKDKYKDKDKDKLELFPKKPIEKNESYKGKSFIVSPFVEVVKSHLLGKVQESLIDNKSEIEYVLDVLSWLDKKVLDNEENFDTEWRTNRNSESLYLAIKDVIQKALQAKKAPAIDLLGFDQLREKIQNSPLGDGNGGPADNSRIEPDQSVEKKGSAYKFVADLFDKWEKDARDEGSCFVKDKNWLLESGVLANILNLMPRLISQWWYDYSILERKSDTVEARYLAAAGQAAVASGAAPASVAQQATALARAERVRRILTREPLGVHRAFVESEADRSLIFRRFMSSILEKPLLGIQYNGLQFEITSGSDTETSGSDTETSGSDSIG